MNGIIHPFFLVIKFLVQTWGKIACVILMLNFYNNKDMQLSYAGSKIVNIYVTYTRTLAEALAERIVCTYVVISIKTIYKKNWCFEILRLYNCKILRSNCRIQFHAWFKFKKTCKSFLNFNLFVTKFKN